MNVEIINTYDIVKKAFEPRESIVIDVSTVASLIQHTFEDILEASKPGLYILGEYFPIIEDKEIVLAYLKDGTEKDFYFDSVITDDILYISNKVGDVLANPYTLKNKNKFFSFKPTIPTVGISLIRDLIDFMCIHNNPCKELLVKDELNPNNSLCVSRREILEASSEEDIISSYIPSSNNMDTEDFMSVCVNIMSYVKDILNHIDLFTLNKPTYIYNSYIKNENVYVYRSMDIRAFRYESMVEVNRQKE